MLKNIILGLSLSIILVALAGIDLPSEQNEQKGSLFNDEYPSYQCKNYFGEFDHCLRAAHNVPVGTLVASANFTKTDNEFIAQHSSKDFRHVAIMGFKNNGTDIQWGKVNGKMALVNHSCDPNSELTSEGNVITIKDVLKDEEITIAYDMPIDGIAWNKKWNFDCLCKTEHCRLHINDYNHARKSRKLNIIG